MRLTNCLKVRSSRNTPEFTQYWRKRSEGSARYRGGTQPSTRRSRGLNVMQSAGTSLSSCASRASFSDLRTRRRQQRKAEEQFQRSLDCARQQEALSWELRTSISLARLHQKEGQIIEAREGLAAGLWPIQGRLSDCRPKGGEGSYGGAILNLSFAKIDND